jgi:hypothetical protein
MYSWNVINQMPSSSKTPFDTARQLARSKPVLAVDQMLFAFGTTRGQRSEQETARWLDELATTVLSANNGPALEAGNDPVAAMLKNRQCDRMACAALMRLLVFDDEVFSQDPRLLHSTALFDRVVGPKLYAEVQLTAKQQSFDKRDRLRHLVENHEDNLIKHVQSLRSLDAFQTFRRTFNELFSHGATRAFVLPFLPTGVTPQTFAECFGSVQAVAEAGDADLVDRADAVAELCRELTDTALTLDTWYAQKLMVDLAASLEQITRQRVAEAGFADPAKLWLSLRPKRYPFGSPGRPVTVRMDLENGGRGQARDVMVRLTADGIDFAESTKPVGMLGSGSRRLEFHGEIAPVKGSEAPTLLATVSWRNPDRTAEETELLRPLDVQNGAVDWERLAFAGPYDLEPVTESEDFVGRDAAVRDLARVILRTGNVRIEGEKRVGKTSLSFAVRNMVKAQSEGGIVFVGLESGDFGANTPEGTIARLGEKIVDISRRGDPRLSGIPTPDFSLGLTTLTDFFEEVLERAPELAFCVILDEFDALSHPSLYQRTPLGDAFFQTLRSLGGKKNLCFVLIGSERMVWVLASHGQTLNKFHLVPLDYFHEDQHDEYAQLVRVPVAEALQFSDESIEALHRATAGNPYMTKLLLKELFDRHVDKHDGDVQVDDVDEAVAYALPKFGPASFQHFWDDAIPGDVEDQEYVSITRRRVLVAFARCKQRRIPPTEDAIVAEARSFKVTEPEARETLQRFRDRSILLADGHGVHSCRVPLFEHWLAQFGTQQIVLGAADDETLVHRQQAIERLRPTPAEVDALARKWRSYRAQDIRPDQIAAWLAQFGHAPEQRAMMSILERLRFYSQRSIAARFADLHDQVLRQLAKDGYNYTLREKQRSRNDLLLCGLDGGASGAVHLVRTYRQENGIYRECAVDAAMVPRLLREPDSKIRAVLVVEDFIATGSTASKGLQELHSSWTEEADWPEGVDVFLLGVCGFERGVEKAEAAARDIGWQVSVRVADVLGEEDRCFSDGSSFFDDEHQQVEAHSLCAKFGAELEPKRPLGFADSQAALCFEHGCPNNSLTVLWKESSNWTPLFPRQ